MGEGDLALAGPRGVGPDKVRLAVHDLDLPAPGQPGNAVGQLVDHALLPAHELFQVDLRAAKADSVLGHLLGLGEHPGGVQQRFGGDAADVEAHAARASPHARP